MNSWVVIPVKPFKKGKSRLRAFFDPQELYALNYHLFVQTVERVKNSASCDGILVISRDKHARETACRLGVDVCAENQPSNLNRAVSQAMQWLRERAQGKVLVLPTDLPELNAEELTLAMRLIPEEGAFIVPDHWYRGTNALGMSQPGLIEPLFGTNSFQKHCQQAQQKKLALKVYYSRSMMHDLDTKPDLEMIQQDHHLLLPVPREERISSPCLNE